MNFGYPDHQDLSMVSYGHHSLDGKLSTNNSYGRAQVAGPEVEIMSTDVLAGRGKISFNHLGNRRFREIINAATDRYNNASSRLEKSMVVHSIVEEVKKTNGRFLKQDRYSGKWYELSEREAKEKCGHAIRDASSSGDPKKKDKVVKKRNSATKMSLSEAVEKQRIRSDSAVCMNDDSSRSSDSQKSDLVWEDDMSNIEPIRHDSFEAKNSLAALHDDDFFLSSLSSVLRTEPGRETARPMHFVSL